MDVITFDPLYMERVWGGRTLEEIYSRKLPHPEHPFGESWEMTDRPDEQSIVNHGPFQGTTLGELWQKHREKIFGNRFENQERFPLLIKILDARDDLSIQVHPPADIAPELGGEPKTEMWYIADAAPDAKLYVGLKKDVSREQFQHAIQNGTVNEVIHAISPKKGDSIFIPSGRLHAIGAGLLIYEIQQNSDTTYRVFDWNRVGLDGHPRALHVDESMRCIDFSDTEPDIDLPDGNTLAQCSYFQVDCLHLTQGTSVGNPDTESFSIVTVVSGRIASADGRTHTAGAFLLMPRDAHPLNVIDDSTILQTTIPC